jgi:hypothetical protein
MSSFVITRQDGTREEFDMPLSGWLRISIANGNDEAIAGTGVYSSSEVRSIELPPFAAIVPPPEAPRLVEREYDLSARDTDGRRWGPEVKFRAMAHDDPPEPPAKPRRKPKGEAA